jgi:tetratricopeptide (TPR) repeat protein
MFSAVLFMLLSAAQATVQSANPDQLYDTAVQAQMAGDFQNAIQKYRDVLKVRPNMVEARVNLGAALAHVGEFAAAINEYQAALPLMQDKTGVLFNIALAYYKQGDWKHAREQFAPLFESQPSDIRIAILLGDTELKLNDNAAAVALLAPLEEANAQNPDFDIVYATALIQSGKRREGIQRAEKAGELGNAADAYALAGATLLQMNEYERARKDLDMALKLNPNLPAPIYSMDGVSRDKTGEPEAAEPAFREALKRDPNDFDANLYLGAIIYKRRQMDEAKTLLEHALSLNPQSSMARYEVAMLNSTAGRTEEAARQLESLVKDDPKWLEPHVELATLYYKLHRPEDGARERQIVERINAEQQHEGPKP